MTPQQVETVKRFTHRYFGEDAVIWLFGSRTNDTKKGGDYDFLIETSLDQPDSIIENKLTMIAGLQSTSTFEDEKIDLIVKRRNTRFELPIYAVAQKEGIRL
jgi:hypothetical protein